MSKKLIVGLGNPGRRYARTRHNLGYWAVDELCETLEAPPYHTRRKALAAEAERGPWKLTLAKPLTFMNLSGNSVRGFLQADRFTPEELLVICDDVNLPLGKIRIRRQGSAGGHHGLESVAEAAGSNQFPRIRIGVKPLEKKLPEDLNGFVLERFEKGEEAAAAQAVRQAVDAVLVILDENFEAAMSRFN